MKHEHKKTTKNRTGCGDQNLYLKLENQTEVDIAKATKIFTGGPPPQMCRKALPDSDMELTVMINEILPPKITSYFS